MADEDLNLRYVNKSQSENVFPLSNPMQASETSGWDSYVIGRGFRIPEVADVNKNYRNYFGNAIIAIVE